jgi:hypothetical protein
MPFFERNDSHPLLSALRARHPGVTIHPDPDDDIGRSCLDYYVILLSQRRFLLPGRIEDFRRRTGRAPSSQELGNLKMDLAREFGERTLHLNTKEISSLRTDEALVFQAVYHAVTTGQRTKIFSGDSDVEEQFYMMIRLLTSHYFALLIADEYVRDFTRFRPRVIDPPQRPGMMLTFRPRGAVVLNLGVRGIHDFIPSLTRFVPISCATVGQHYTSEVTYGAETSMARVFAIKSKTHGLSTAGLGSRNIHPWCVPEELTPPGDHGALVAFDEYIESRASRMRIAAVDIAMTMGPDDPHVRIAPPSPGQARLVPARATGQVIAMRARTSRSAGLWLPGSVAA